MDIEQIIKLVIDNSVTVAIVAYFLLYNWKFTDSIQVTQTQLTETVRELKVAIEKLLEK